MILSVFTANASQISTSNLFHFCITSLVEMLSCETRSVLSIGSVVLKVHDVRRAAAFWCAALGYEALREVADDFVILGPSDGLGQRISLDRDGGDAPDFPHIHLDLYAGDAADQAAEVERLIGLGAERVADWPYPDGPHDFVVLADPEGNRFCVIDTVG